MTYKEFCVQIAPDVLELQKECRKMTEEEFWEYRENTLEEIRQKMPKSCDKFITAVLDMIYQNVFGKSAQGERKTGPGTEVVA